MIMSVEAQERIEAHLDRLHRRLRGMKAEDAREIVQELRSHILDKAGEEMTLAGVDGALAGLGTPEELASQYMTDDLLARAVASRSPLRILESLFRWATLSIVGFFVFLGSIVGYVLGVVLILSAALKSFHPRTAGLWVSQNTPDDWAISLRLGFGTEPAGGREVLGWWIIPVGLGVGCSLLFLTTRLALWCVRRYRQSRAVGRR